MSATSTSNAAAPPLSLSLRLRLSTMMFLQYAIWGAWLPLLWSFLQEHRGFSPNDIGMMFSIGGVGALIAPFVAGQIADRHFSTEKFLGISHLLGAVLMWQLAELTSYSSFLIFSLLYALVYMPTLALTNSLSFHHLPDRDRDFSQVRVWGTVGWIAVGIGMGHWLLHRYTPEGPAITEAAKQAVRAAQVAGMADAFRLSALLGVAMGLFCFTLPHTPPSVGREKNAALEALGEVKRNPLLTLFLVAIPISCVHQFYMVHAAQFLGLQQSKLADKINEIFGVGGGGLMTIGQMSEIIVLAIMPLLAKKLSRKSLLLIGTVAYALRMALFAYVDSIPLPHIFTLVSGVALHGVCFSCFIFVAFMIVDEESTPDVRASAQSLFNLVVVGFGIIVGSMFSAKVAAWASSTALNGKVTVDYARLFSVPMWIALACLAALIVFYPSRRRTA